MRTTILLCIVSVLCPFTILFAQGEPCDFNGNGHVDVSDLARISNYLFCLIPFDSLPDYWPEGDCDQDSIHLTVADGLSASIRLIYGYGNGHGRAINSTLDTLFLPNATAAPGDSITLPVHIRTERLLSGVQFYLLYDSTIIHITDLSIPDSMPPYSFAHPCYFGNAISALALPYTVPGPFYDPLAYITFRIADDAPMPSQVLIEFANDPHRPAYTGLAVFDSSAVPPEPDIMFIRPVTIDGIINITSTAVSDETTPRDDRLSLDIWANPSNPDYQILFHLPQASDIDLGVYDLLGRRFAGLASGRYSAGDHAIAWNAGSLASGIYFLRLATGDDHVIRKLTLLK